MNITTLCFDAFCYEPIPYRSAVQEGATHVLALKTRPNGKPIATKPGLFEKYFAPTHFVTHGMPEVSNFFENQGQQYIYVEDYYTLDEGKYHSSNVHKKGVLVPPQKLLYGVDCDEEAKNLVSNREAWKRAHLFPIAVPEGKPELSALSVDQDEVLEGVRLGFAAAFDILAPIANIDLNEHLMNGERVAELLFSHAGTAINVLEKPVSVEGDFIVEREGVSITKEAANKMRNAYILQECDSVLDDDDVSVALNNGRNIKEEASQLLEILPGFNHGRMVSLSQGLRELKRGKALKANKL